jgi:hypothetical protein
MKTLMPVVHGVVVYVSHPTQVVPLKGIILPATVGGCGLMTPSYRHGDSAAGNATVG